MKALRANFFIFIAAMLLGGASKADTKIESIASIVSDAKDEIKLVAGMERCAALNLFMSVKLDQSGFAEKAEESKTIAYFFAASAARLENSVSRTRGLKERDLTDKETLLYADAIVQMAVMYAEESKQNYSRTGSHIAGLVLSDVETCKAYLPILLK